MNKHQTFPVNIAMDKGSKLFAIVLLKGGKMVPTIKVPVVVGHGCCQVLVVNEIPLDPPALEIEEIKKEVVVDHCSVVSDRVIINGTLHKNIVYKTLEDCDEFDGIPRRCGELRHCTVTIPFSCFIEVPGACPGDHCQVEKAAVEGESDQLLDETNQETYETLEEKAIVVIDVKVTREQQICIHGWDH